jgi:hypothetical protein
MVAVNCVVALVFGTLGAIRAAASMTLVSRGLPISAPTSRGAYPGVELPGERWERQTYKNTAELFARYAPLVILGDVGRLLIGLVMAISAVRCLLQSRLGWEVLAYALLFAAVLVVYETLLQYYAHLELTGFLERLRAELNELERNGFVYRIHPTRFDDVVEQVRLAMTALYFVNAGKFVFYLAALNYLFRPAIADLFRRQ